MRRVFLVLGVVAALAACSRGEPNLMNAAANSPSDGPDEFSIVPNNPLETPASYAVLPTPTPGSPSLADPDPMGDMAVALGGRRNATRITGRVTGPALIAHTGRFGSNPNIRTVLAEEDLEYRKRNRGRLLERVFRVNRYFSSYEAMSLDQNAELARLRRLGVITPAAPPIAPR